MIPLVQLLAEDFVHHQAINFLYNLDKILCHIFNPREFLV